MKSYFPRDNISSIDFKSLKSFIFVEIVEAACFFATFLKQIKRELAMKTNVFSLWMKIYFLEDSNKSDEFLIS